jgi:hypothetical protein
MQHSSAVETSATPSAFISFRLDKLGLQFVRIREIHVKGFRLVLSVAAGIVRVKITHDA